MKKCLQFVGCSLILELHRKQGNLLPTPSRLTFNHQRGHL
ncbi:hypothetical protein LDFHOB_13570 [Candidatus Electronema aureum]